MIGCENCEISYEQSTVTTEKKNHLMHDLKLLIMIYKFARCQYPQVLSLIFNFLYVYKFVFL